MSATKSVLFEWKDAYSVSNTLIDGQHKVLIGLLNSLHAAMREGKGRDVSGLMRLNTTNSRPRSSNSRRLSRLAPPGFPSIFSSS